IRAVSAKSPLVTLRLRKCTGYEDSPVLTASASGTYQENNILPTLQTGFDAVEVICAVHRLLVDLENDIPTVEANIIAKSTRLHILHDHALTCGDVEAISDLRCQGAHGNPELAFFGLLLIATFFFFAQARAQEFRSVGNGYRGVLFFAVANDRQLGLGTGLLVGDIGHQFVTILYFLAVDSGDGVTHLQSRLFSGAACHDIGDGHARVHAVNAGNRGHGLCVELYSDRSAGY